MSLQSFKFNAVIFDMDGTLTDSEPLWKIAMEEAFRSVGCHITREQFALTAGMRIDEVIEYWYNAVGWENASTKDVEKRIIDKMDELIRQTATPLPGVMDTLAYLRAEGFKIGLGTSSYEQLIHAVLDTLKINDCFDFVHSAEKEEHGKPHPAVFMTVANALDEDPSKCLVIEDSFNGVLAGKAAKMKVVCIPEKTHKPDPRLIIADFHYESMADMLRDLKDA